MSKAFVYDLGSRANILTHILIYLFFMGQLVAWSEIMGNSC